MIIEKICGKLAKTDKKIEIVTIEWFEREKKLLKKVSSGGTEIGLRLTEPLSDGDILYEDDDKIIAVEIAPCELIKISVSSMREMGRLCFEIGNRHLSLAISDSDVKIPYDEPTFLYLKKLGFNAERVTEKFTDFTECKAHGHSHEHGEHHHGHHHSHIHPHEHH